MATHDYDIANQSGAAFRTDLNNALAAIQSNNSNSSSPATTVAYQWWADTTSGTLKIRNSANNASVELLQLDGTITLDDGTNSLPALAFRDDLNTGIYSSGADTFNIATGGVERMELSGQVTIFNEDGADCDFRIEGDTEPNLFFVDASADRIGIGTSSVDRHFHVEGTDNVMGKFQSNQSLCLIEFEDTDTTSGNRPSVGADGNNLIFFTGGSTSGGFDSSGRFGVGTLSMGSFNANADDIVINGSGNAGISIITPNSNIGRVAFGDPEDDNACQITYNHSSNGLAFDILGTEHMRLDSDGRLLIGTSTAVGGVAAHLQVVESDGGKLAFARNDTTVSAGAELGRIQALGNDSDGNYQEVGKIIFEADKNHGTNDKAGRITFYTTSDNASSATERMRIDSSGLVSVKTSGLKLENATATNSRSFSITNASGTTGWSFGNGITASAHQFVIYDNTAGAARMEIDSSGNTRFSEAIGLGTNAKLAVASSGINPRVFEAHATHASFQGITLQSVGSRNTTNGSYRHFQCVINGIADKMRVEDSGNVTNANNSYGSISDERLKENIVDASSQWDDIKALRIRKFNFKSLTDPDKKPMLGVVAQEAELVCPNLVTSSVTLQEGVEQEYKSFKYSILYMKAIKCLQEAQAKIETLETKVAALEAA